MTSFKKLNTNIYEKHTSIKTPDFIYWKKLSAPVLVKEFGPIDYIDFSPVEPYHFSVTCSVRVQIYNSVTKLVTKNFSRFRENAYGAVFRSDGKLLCTGGEEKNVKLFDVSTKNLLRLFKGHSAAVHRTFFVEGKPQIASFSDDKSVKIWDIATEANIVTYSDHSDYIRAGATTPVIPDIVLSGSYDNTVKMYDTRMNQSVLSVNHGKPIESLLFLQSGSIFLSAGGTEIKIWDMVAGGKLLGCISQHHKTITCLRLASDNKRLLSGSLDKHVKIYNLSNYKVVHTLDYSNAILSLGVSKNDDTVAVGFVDGLVAISRREDENMKKDDKKNISFQHKTNLTIDTIVPQIKYDKEAKHDKCLRKFEYSKALDSVLVPYVVNKNPQVTVGVLQELMKRRALHKAYLGRDSKSIIQILSFFIRHITETRFAKVLVDAVNIFLDTYESNPIMTLPKVRNLLINLLQLLKEEDENANEMTNLQGAMHMLLSAATIQSDPNLTLNGHKKLIPSAEAQKNLIVNLT